MLPVLPRACLVVPDVTSARTSSRGPLDARLIASWRRALDAFGDALSADKRYYSTVELKELERELAADRRWLEHFSAIRSFL